MKLGQKFVKNLVGFLEDLKIPKFHSEINWPLAQHCSVHIVQPSLHYVVALYYHHSQAGLAKKNCRPWTERRCRSFVALPNNLSYLPLQSLRINCFCSISISKKYIFAYSSCEVNYQKSVPHFRMTTKGVLYTRFLSLCPNYYGN